MKNKEYVYTHPNTVWEIIKTQLLRDIAEDVYKVGERVPSTNDLTKQYNVSVNTAGKALEFLRDEEIIMKKRGVGFFVLPYAKTKSINLLKKDFDEQIHDVIRMARIMGYSKDEMISAISDIWE